MTQVKARGQSVGKGGLLVGKGGLPAAGVEVDRGQEAIGRRAQRWTFDFPGEPDVTAHDAVRAAAAFLVAHRADLGDAGPANATQLAVLATEVHHLFSGGDEPDPQVVVAEVRRRLR